MPPDAQGLQGGEPGDGHDRGLLEGHRRRLGDELVLTCGRIFGERAPADPEHLVAGEEPRDLGADVDHGARHIQARDGLLRTTKAEPDDAHEVGLARHEVPGAAIHACRPHLHEDLVRRKLGLVDGGQLQSVR